MTLSWHPIELGKAPRGFWKQSKAFRENLIRRVEGKNVWLVRLNISPAYYLARHISPLIPPFNILTKEYQQFRLHSPSSIPSAIIMNTITQLATRSARLNGSFALHQVNPITRRAFTKGMSAYSHPRQLIINNYLL
jgi:hypothetical protein